MKRYTMATVAIAALLTLGACGQEETAEEITEATVSTNEKSDDEACEIITTAYTSEKDAVQAAEGAADDDPLTTDATTAKAALKQAIQDSMLKAEDEDLKATLTELHSNPLQIMGENEPEAVETYYSNLDSVVEKCTELTK